MPPPESRREGRVRTRKVRKPIMPGDGTRKIRRAVAFFEKAVKRDHHVRRAYVAAVSVTRRGGDPWRDAYRNVILYLSRMD